MQADYIGEIVKRLGESPYRCIMFDGKWGIGKTYAIDDALKEQENVCKISMFGLQSSQQIYHEALFQLALKNNKAGKFGKTAANILKGVAKVWDKAAQAKDVFQSIVKERELFLLLSREFDSLHIIVIDDLERISKKVSLEEVLGIVEELKTCNYVRVILVTNTKELQDSDGIFEKYKEKVIDRAYQITERPEKINWGDLGIHGGFMTKFLSVHNVKNLRTLQKAQKFYDDVRRYCSENLSEHFLNEIRLICFAIVVESTDNLYYKEPDENEKDSITKSIKIIHNELEHRILNYLNGIRCGKSLVSMLFMYYNNEIMLTENDMKIEYEIFLQAGKKSNFYKSDNEIKQSLPSLYKKIETADTLGDLNKFADEYVLWGSMIQEDVTKFLNLYKNKLHDMLFIQAIEGHEEILSYDYDLWHTESEIAKSAYLETRDIVKKEIIVKFIAYLSVNTKDKQAYDFSYRLRKCFQSSFYRDIVKEHAEKLYNKNSFPVGSIVDNQYHTCYNIMYVLYHLDSTKFLEYCDELVKECDKMSAHRIDVLVKEITKGI